MLSANIRKHRKAKGLTQDDLARKLGIKRTALASYEEGRAQPRLPTLCDLAHFFEISLDSLVFDNEVVEPIQLNYYLDGVEQSDMEWIPLIPEKAAAGYTHGFADQEYMETLPISHLSFPELAGKKNLRIFQSSGDSMLPIPNGAYLICEFVKNANSLKRNEAYVFCSKQEGLLFKRYLGVEQTVIKLHSDNVAYPQIELELNELQEVWRVLGSCAMGNPSAPMSINAANLADGIGQIQDQLKRIEKKLD